MENNHLSRRVDSAKSENSDVIDDLIREIEELEEKNYSLENKIETLESKIEELESIVSEQQNDIEGFNNIMNQE